VILPFSVFRQTGARTKIARRSAGARCDGDLMRRRCPNCKSLDVRRCVAYPRGERASWFRSRFRCRDCKESFLMMNHRAYRLFGFFVRVNAAFFAVIAALVFVYRS